MEKLTKVILPILSFIFTAFIFYYLGRYGINSTQIIGVTLVVIGYAMWFIGRSNLGNSYSLLPKAEKIVSKGLYSKIKHPLYLSQLMVLGGAILYIDDSRLWWIFIAILILQFYRAKKEEKVLLEKFGDDYKNYMKSTWV